jgi:hypothetical protein
MLRQVFVQKRKVIQKKKIPSPFMGLEDLLPCSQEHFTKPFPMRIY